MRDARATGGALAPPVAHTATDGGVSPRRWQDGAATIICNQLLVYQAFILQFEQFYYDINFFNFVI